MLQISARLCRESEREGQQEMREETGNFSMETSWFIRTVQIHEMTRYVAVLSSGIKLHTCIDECSSVPLLYRKACWRPVTALLISHISCRFSNTHTRTVSTLGNTVMSWHTGVYSAVPARWNLQSRYCEYAQQHSWSWSTLQIHTIP